MLKYVLLGSAMAIATPAIAQEAATTTPTQPMAAETQAMPAEEPVTTEDQTAKADEKAAETAATRTTESAPVETATMPQAAPPTDPAAPMTAAPAQSAQADPAAPAMQPAPAQSAQAPAAAQPAGGDQVASIVNSEFGSYDKDQNGTLDKMEFAAWMDALKAKAPDGAGKPSDAKWNEAAFAQADTDKSTTVTKQELTGFLGGASRAGAM